MSHTNQNGGDHPLEIGRIPDQVLRAVIKDPRRMVGNDIIATSLRHGLAGTFGPEWAKRKIDRGADDANITIGKDLRSSRSLVHAQFRHMMWALYHWRKRTLPEGYTRYSDYLERLGTELGFLDDEVWELFLTLMQMWTIISHQQQVKILKDQPGCFDGIV